MLPHLVRAMGSNRNSCTAVTACYTVEAIARGNTDAQVATVCASAIEALLLAAADGATSLSACPACLALVSICTGNATAQSHALRCAAVPTLLTIIERRDACASPAASALAAICSLPRAADAAVEHAALPQLASLLQPTDAQQPAAAAPGVAKAIQVVLPSALHGATTVAIDSAATSIAAVVQSLHVLLQDGPQRSSNACQTSWQVHDVELACCQPEAAAADAAALAHMQLAPDWVPAEPRGKSPPPPARLVGVSPMCATACEANLPVLALARAACDMAASLQEKICVADTLTTLVSPQTARASEASNALATTS